jgi:hypothetical protein
MLKKACEKASRLRRDLREFKRLSNDLTPQSSHVSFLLPRLHRTTSTQLHTRLGPQEDHFRTQSWPMKAPKSLQEGEIVADVRPKSQRAVARVDWLTCGQGLTSPDSGWHV